MSKATMMTVKFCAILALLCFGVISLLFVFDAITSETTTKVMMTVMAACGIYSITSLLFITIAGGSAARQPVKHTEKDYYMNNRPS